MSVAAGSTSRAGRAVSLLRGELVIHAEGEVFAAALEILDGAERLDVPLVRGPRRRDALVRFSRGASLPDVMPDVLGLAVRVPDADGAGGAQDLLLSTSRRPPLVRYLPWPARDLLRSTYSSLTMFEIDGDRLLVGACGAHGTHGARRPADVPGGRLLLATAPARGPWEPFARLVVGQRVSGQGDLDVSLANDAGGFVAAEPSRDGRPVEPTR